MFFKKEKKLYEKNKCLKLKMCSVLYIRVGKNNNNKNNNQKHTHTHSQINITTQPINNIYVGIQLLISTVSYYFYLPPDLQSAKHI